MKGICLSHMNIMGMLGKILRLTLFMCKVTNPFLKVQSSVVGIHPIHFHFQIYEILNSDYLRQ